MIIKTKNLIIRAITEKDIKGVIEVYNSNQDFLIHHIGKREVSPEWLLQEQKEMNATNFRTLVVAENKSNTIIGFIDIDFTEECYLSLLMVHEAFRCRGYGKEIYDEIENYSRKHNLKGIRIDVACEYNEIVLQFWRNRGFKEIKGIKLQWADKSFDAIVMKKYFEE